MDRSRANDIRFPMDCAGVTYAFYRQKEPANGKEIIKFACILVRQHSEVLRPAFW